MAEMTTLWRYNRQEQLIGSIIPLEAKRLQKLTGEDTLELVTTEPLSKLDRVIYQDERGLYHEFIAMAPSDKREASGEITFSTYLENSIVELRQKHIEDRRAYDTTIGIALGRALDETRWDIGILDALGAAGTNYYRISAYEAILKAAEAWSAEIYPTITVSGNQVASRSINAVRKRGVDIGKRFEYGKDILGITRTVTEHVPVTRLYPYGAAEESESGEGYGRRIDISSVNNGLTYIEDTQATASWGIPDGQGGYLPNEGVAENHDIDDPQALKAWGLSQLEELSKPEVIYEVEVIDLEHVAPWEGIDIGDTVRVIDREFEPAITITARVLELERNLLDKADTKVVLGNYIPSITDIISRGAAAYDLVNGTVDDAGMIKANFITSLLPRLSALFGLGSNYIDMSEERGIVITDRPTEAESTWAMQLASAGFRIASSKLPDGSWNWRTFGTGSGFTADVINAGHLRGGAVDFDLENGALTINSQLGNNAVRVVLSGSEALSIYSDNRLIGGLVMQPDGSVINIATAIRSEKPDYLGWGTTLKIGGLSADEVTDPSSVGSSGFMFDGIQLQSDAYHMSIVSDGVNGGLWIDRNNRVRLRYNQKTSALIGFNEDGTYSIADIGNESVALTHGAKSWMHWQEGNFKTRIVLDDTGVKVYTPTGSANIVKSFQEIRQALTNAGIAIPTL